MTCKLWDVATGKLVQDVEAEGFVQCVMFNPEGNQGLGFIILILEIMFR